MRCRPPAAYRDPLGVPPTESLPRPDGAPLAPGASMKVTVTGGHHMRPGVTAGQLLTGSALLAALVAPVPAAGQVAPGDRVCVTVGERRITGRLDRPIGDSVVVVTDSGERYTYGRAVPRRLEMSLGRRSWKLTGAAVGLGIGGVAGLFVGMAADRSADTQVERDCYRGPSGQCVWSGGRIGDGIEIAMGVGIGAVAGAAVGALAGSPKVERWRQVPVPRVAAWPHPRGAVVAIGWRATLGGSGARR